MSKTEKLRYEAPTFECRELFLFEGVAGTCWGYGHVFVRVYRDINSNNYYDSPPDIPVLYREFFYNPENPNETGHCHNVAQQVRNAIGEVSGEYAQYLESVSSGENSHSLSDVPIQEFAIS